MRRHRNRNRGGRIYGEDQEMHWSLLDDPVPLANSCIHAMLGSQSVVEPLERLHRINHRKVEAIEELDSTGMNEYSG